MIDTRQYPMTMKETYITNDYGRLAAVLDPDFLAETTSVQHHESGWLVRVFRELYK